MTVKRPFQSSRRAQAAMSGSYTLYILECADRSLYTGIAKQLECRLEAHRKGRGSKYVFSRLPFRLAHAEGHPSRSEALKKEAAIKKLSREDKRMYIEKAAKPSAVHSFRNGKNRRTRIRG